MKLKYIDYENEIFVKAKIKLLEVKKNGDNSYRVFFLIRKDKGIKINLDNYNKKKIYCYENDNKKPCDNSIKTLFDIFKDFKKVEIIIISNKELKIFIDEKVFLITND